MFKKIKLKSFKECMPSHIIKGLDVQKYRAIYGIEKPFRAWCIRYNSNERKYYVASSYFILRASKYEEKNDVTLEGDPNRFKQALVSLELEDFYGTDGSRIHYKNVHYKPFFRSRLEAENRLKIYTQQVR